MYATVELLKKHLNIDTEFTDDDQYLALLSQVAEKTVQRHVCCVLSEMEDEEGHIPTPLLQAILLYAGVLYNSRESVAFGGNPVDIPHTYEYLVNLYKNYSDTTSDDFVASVLADLASLALIVDTPQEEQYGDYGNLVINNESQKKAVQNIVNNTSIDANGNLVANVERI